MAGGTITTLDTLAANTTQTVVDFGEDRIWEAIDANVRIQNELLTEMLGGLADVSTDRLRRYGGVDEMTMEDLDQIGRPDAQKLTSGSNVGFPLRLKGGSLQWTRIAFMTMRVGELAKHAQGFLAADRKAVMTEIKRAMMFTANYTFADVLVDNVDLPVKRLVNADSAAIPLGPNGETFNAATHTHYLATASFVAANLTSLIDTVAEHVNTGQIMVYINSAQEATVRAFTGFTAYADPRIQQYPTTSTIPFPRVSLLNIGNRAIGIFGAAEVWVKPWVPANYVICLVVGGGRGKPLVMRERSSGSGGFGLVAEDELHPLRAQTYQREFGFGVWNRVGAAVLYTGGGSYTNPSL